jgi:NDP-sugar pyrophosphorylase family protein
LTPPTQSAGAGRRQTDDRLSLLLLRHYEFVTSSSICITGEQIETYLGDGAKLGLKISYSIETNSSIPAAVS